MNAFRVGSLAAKETLQIVRDPSVILIAFVLPVVMLFLFAYAVSLDMQRVPVGLVLESDGAAASSLAAAFASNHSFAVTPARDRRELADSLLGERVRGYVVIPQDFERRLAAGGPPRALVQVITDGTQTNTASFIGVFASGVVADWLAARSRAPAAAARFEPRFWFNPEIESRRFLVPGAIAIVMTMIGTLLTALVMAREWERGTMEALMSTPVTVPEIMAGKLLPYFGLGLAATLLSALLAVTVFDVPLRGSWAALLLASSVFLVPALGQGLLISTLARNQFIAAQAALISGFLPAFLLSGFLFEIDSMPWPIRALTHAIPARYYVASLQTLFLAGNVWERLAIDMAAMLAIGVVFFGLVRARTRKSLEA